MPPIISVLIFIPVLYIIWNFSERFDKGVPSRIGYNILYWVSNKIPRAFVAILLLLLHGYAYYRIIWGNLSDAAQINAYLAVLASFVFALSFFKDSLKYRDANKNESDSRKLEEANYELLSLLTSFMITAFTMLVALLG